MIRKFCEMEMRTTPSVAAKMMTVAARMMHMRFALKFSLASLPLVSPKSQRSTKSALLCLTRRVTTKPMTK